MRFFNLALVIPVLAACNTFDDISVGMQQMRGLPLDRAVNVLGVPSGERAVGGRRYVIWSTNRNVSFTTPVTSYTSGSVSTSVGGNVGHGSYSGTTTTFVPQTASLSCTLTVEVDEDYIIQNYQFEGHRGGCEAYAARLRDYYESLPPA